MSIIASILIISGSLFSLISALGVFRFKCFYTRVQAASKSSALGIILVYVGISIEKANVAVSTKSFAIIIFLLLTLPAATHAIVKAYRSRDRGRS